MVLKYIANIYQYSEFIDQHESCNSVTVVVVVFSQLANRQQQNLLPLAEEETEVVLHRQHPGRTQCLSLIEAELTRSSPRIREAECRRASHQPSLHVILHRLQKSVCCGIYFLTARVKECLVRAECKAKKPNSSNNRFHTFICT